MSLSNVKYRPNWPNDIRCVIHNNPSLHLGAAPGMAYGVSLANRHYVDVKEQDNKLGVGKISHNENPTSIICTMGDGDAIVTEDSFRIIIV
jgi:hypothetical protein